MESRRRLSHGSHCQGVFAAKQYICASAFVYGCSAATLPQCVQEALNKKSSAVRDPDPHYFSISDQLLLSRSTSRVQVAPGAA